MKNYIRPIAEVSKFDVADIITISGDIVSADKLAAENQAIYAEYQAAAGANTNVTVFQW